MNANPIWLKSYPEGVPSDIDPTQYTSLVGLLEESFSKYSDRVAYSFLGKDFSFTQTDQDSLPAYEVLDAIVERYMENDQGVEDIVTAGFERADVEKVTRLIKINEYKRRQAPIGIRVTHRSFGKDWRYPITNKFRA